MSSSVEVPAHNALQAVGGLDTSGSYSLSASARLWLLKLSKSHCLLGRSCLKGVLGCCQPFRVLIVRMLEAGHAQLAFFVTSDTGGQRQRCWAQL